MSSRALRKLHGKQEIEISTNDDDLEEDETDDKDLQSAVNPFALVKNISIWMGCKNVILFMPISI